MHESRGKLSLNIISYVYLFFVAAYAVYALSSLFFNYPQNSFDSKNVISLKDGWLYSVDGSAGKIIELPQTRDVPEAGEITISRNLPTDIAQGASLAVYSSFQNIKVDIGGWTVLDYRGTEGILYTDVPVTQIMFIPLKPEYGGSTISVRYSSPLASRKGVMHEIFLGSKADIIYHMIEERLIILLAGMLLLLIGVVVLCYRAFAGTRGVTGEAMQFQGIYLILLGIFFVLQTGMNQIFFQDLNWSRFLEFYAIMIIPTAYILEVNAVEKHIFGKAADILCIICLVSGTYESCMTVFGHIDYMRINWITYAQFAMAILFAAVTLLIIALKEKGLYAEMKWMIYAFISIAAGGVGEIMMYYIDSTMEDCRILACGVLLHFFFTMRWIMQENNMQETEKERAVQQAEAKSAFLANMSHEIRTPVIAILGINDMIIRDCREEDILTYAKDMHYAGKDLLALINNILDYSKIESGRMEVICADYRLMPMLQTLASDTRDAIGIKDIRFEMEADASLPSEFNGDEAKIRQILWNMLQNAAKYTASGTIKMTVSGRSRDEGTMRLCFSVTDTGEGMSRETRQRVFESFNHDYSGNTPGIGLGLSLSGSLARQMGGTMEVRSTEGTGSRFTLWITQKVVDNVPNGEYHDSDKPYEELLKNMKADILIADDEIMNIDIIFSMLKNTGISADAAHDGPEALKKAREKKYDVIFLDYMMPGMDGGTVLDKLRARRDGVNAVTPVVMLSAGTGNDTWKRYSEAGFAGFIVKPVRESEFTGLLCRLLCSEPGKAGRL